MRKLLLAAFLLVASASGALATNLTPGSYTPVATIPLTAGTSSSNASLGTVGTNYYATIKNTGTTQICAKLGTSGVTAATTDTPIDPGEVAILPVGSNSYVAVISQSGTDAVEVKVTNGMPTAFFSIPSGPQTANQGTGAGVGSGWNTDPDIAVYGATMNSATYHSVLVQTLNNHQATVVYTLSGVTASGGQLTVRGTADGGNTWSSVNAQAYPAATAAGLGYPIISTDNQYCVNTGGLNQVELYVSTAGTGTITVSYNISSAVACPSNPPMLPGPWALIGQGCNVSLTSGACLSSSQTIKHAGIQNVSGTVIAANTYCTWVNGSAVIGSKTTFETPIAPAPLRDYGPNTGGVPSNGLTCIADHVGVLTAAIAAGGTGYGTSQTCAIPLSSGTGTQASLNVTTNGSGVVTTINAIASPGSYTASPTLSGGATGTAGSPCSSGSGFTATVTVGAPLYVETW